MSLRMALAAVVMVAAVLSVGHAQSRGDGPQMPEQEKKSLSQDDVDAAVKKAVADALAKQKPAEDPAVQQLRLKAAVSKVWRDGMTALESVCRDAGGAEMTVAVNPLGQPVAFMCGREIRKR